MPKKKNPIIMTKIWNFHELFFFVVYSQVLEYQVLERLRYLNFCSKNIVQ